MNKNYDKVFVSGPLNAIDFLNPATGKSYVEGETLEQIQVRYPGAQLVDFDAWNDAKEKALCTEPAPITEERFFEALEVLPPQRWYSGRTVSGKSCESFECCEHLCGRVTSVCARIGKKYFEFNAVAGQPLEAHIVYCSPEDKLAVVPKATATGEEVVS